MVIFTDHARDKMAEREVTEDEVVETLQFGDQVQVRQPRLGRRRVFTEGYETEGGVHPHKEVTVIYAEESSSQVVVTIIARYGRWESAP